jgi:hypothetical protein
MFTRLGLLCLAVFVSQLEAKPYDEKMAKKILPLASAAYSKNPKLCLGNAYQNAEVSVF